MNTFQRIFLLVMDSVGIGEAPDAERFGDVGANTLGHIAKEMDGLYMPTMEKLGLGNIAPIRGIKQIDKPNAHFGKMQEASNGKDTMTGHWELMGLHIEEPFQVFPHGFSNELITKLEKQTGRKVIGNKVASGTHIIAELAKEQKRTGALIVYTSADSVLQIAAHEDVIPLEELYHICEIARKLTLHFPHKVGRVIARPYVGDGPWQRTANRRDYALKPHDRTVMNTLVDARFDSIAIGKISDIFAGEGITKSIRTVSDEDGMKKLRSTMDETFTGLCFVNLVDFDALYGHRRDPIGYGNALEKFDTQLHDIVKNIKKNDLLIITADHGNDPTFPGTDHTREFVPLIAYTKGITNGKYLGVRSTFADVGATIAHNFNVALPPYGTSFLQQVKGEM